MRLPLIVREVVIFRKHQLLFDANQPLDAYFIGFSKEEALELTLPSHRKHYEREWRKLKGEADGGGDDAIQVLVTVFGVIFSPKGQGFTFKDIDLSFYHKLAVEALSRRIPISSLPVVPATAANKTFDDVFSK